MSTNKLIVSTLFALSLTTSCAQDMFITHNGNMPTDERIDRIKVGSSKDSVLMELGAPSNVVSFDKNTWIYMSQDIEQMAFFKPKEISRDILTIQFNDFDEVKEITNLNETDGVDVVVSSEKTQTLGQQPGWFKKTFGTFGGYNPLGGAGL